MISTVYISPILTLRPSCSFPDFSHSHALRSSQSDSFNDPVFLTVFGTVSEYRERFLWIFLGNYFVDLIRACKDKLLEARHDVVLSIVLSIGPESGRRILVPPGPLSLPPRWRPRSTTCSIRARRCCPQIRSIYGRKLCQIPQKPYIINYYQLNYIIIYS